MNNDPIIKVEDETDVRIFINTINLYIIKTSLYINAKKITIILKSKF
jgi:hypothetical protein